MKKTIKFLLVLACVVALVFSCKSKKANDDAVAPTSEATETVEATPVADVEPINIPFGDYDAMFAFSKQAQNGELTEGQIVTIDGNLSVGFDASIGQRKDDTFYGTILQVTGWATENFPEDGSRVKVTAKVVRNKDFFFEYLVANPEDVVVVENTAEAE